MYQAMEALIASKRSNPLHDSHSTSSDVAKSTSNCGVAKSTSNGGVARSSTSGVATSIEMSPSSNGSAVANGWPNGRIKKSISGHGFESSAATSTTNTTDEEVHSLKSDSVLNFQMYANFVILWGSAVV